MFRVAFIGNCQTVSLCFFLQQLLAINKNYLVKWCLYGDDFKAHVSKWSDKCKNKTYDLSPNDVLLLSIPQKLQDDNIRLHDCLDNMFNVENIEYKCENASCDNTHNNRSQKFIISNPKVLIITIKRYLQLPNGRFVKINKMINYPEVLNIQKYYCGNDHREYELYSVINHTGSIDSGHYYSYIRTMKDDGKGFNDQWLCCNDSQVSLITDEQALSSQNAYMLFYNMI